jgi:hypothetical protein
MAAAKLQNASLEGSVNRLMAPSNHLPELLGTPRLPAGTSDGELDACQHPSLRSSTGVPRIAFPQPGCAGSFVSIKPEIVVVETISSAPANNSTSSTTSPPAAWPQYQLPGRE